jgi:hypothetical protein
MLAGRSPGGYRRTPLLPTKARPALATLIPLADIDPALIEDLLDAPFGAGRCARTANKVRAGTDWLPALSFAALDGDDKLAGSIQGWPVRSAMQQGAKCNPPEQGGQAICNSE